MIQKLRTFLQTKSGVALGVVLFAAAIYVAYDGLRSTFGASDLARDTRDIVCLDTATNQPFTVRLVEGLQFPCKSPSGQMTGYPAEACYWAKDGKPKDSPTYVVLNGRRGIEGPTFCPDCERLVVAQNPPAVGTPPPTKHEYARKP